MLTFKRLRHGILVLVSMLVGMAMGILLTAFYSASIIYDFRDTIARSRALPEVDVIVCLAGAKGRIRSASELWFRYWQKYQNDREDFKRGEITIEPKLPRFYVSGMGPRANWSVMADQVRPEILKHLKKEFVTLETESANTVENALWMIDRAKQQGWTKFLLVTSTYHLKRAYLIFDQIFRDSGLRNYTIETSAIYQDPFLRHRWKKDFYGIRVTLEEFLKWAYYRGIWQRRP